MLVNNASIPPFAPLTSGASGASAFRDFDKAFGTPELPMPGLQAFDREFNSMGQAENQAPTAGHDFSSMLNDAISQIDAQDHKASQVALDMALGQDIDPHKVMIEQAKDSVLLNLASGVATKTAQDFTTLMNMQI